MAATNIGSNKYPLAKVPEMADAADIQVALKYYHWGQEAEPEGTATAGISKYLDDIDTRIDDIDTTLTNVVEETVIDAKGDLFVGTANNAVDNLTVGSDGHVLTADSTNATYGLKWSAPTVSTSQITGLGTGIATWLGTPSSANLASAITDETGSGSLVFGTTPTLTRSFHVSPREKVTVSATAATGTINFDVVTQSVLYYTTNATGNFTLNIRGDGSTTLNSLLDTGDALTVVFLVTNGATAYYHSALTVDGSSVTPKWQGGTAPSFGNTSSIDSYSYTVIKTGNAAFTVLASQIRFA
jgi:hypothetical protein